MEGDHLAFDVSKVERSVKATLSSRLGAPRSFYRRWRCWPCSELDAEALVQHEADAPSTGPGPKVIESYKICI